MKRTRRILFTAVYACLAWAGLLLAGRIVWLTFTTPAQQEFQDRFPQVGIGMTRSAVVELLGRPEDEGPVFHLRQETGFESEYARARASGATAWLYWHVGIDLTYAVGMDGSDRVCMTSHGGT